MRHPTGLFDKKILPFSINRDSKVTAPGTLRPSQNSSTALHVFMHGVPSPALNAELHLVDRQDAWKQQVRQFVKPETSSELKSQLYSDVFQHTNYRLPAPQACPHDMKERVQQRILAAVHHSNMQAFLDARRCMQFTRCKSRRLPSANLQYLDVDTGLEVSADEYERRYIMYLNYMAQKQSAKTDKKRPREDEKQPAAADNESTTSDTDVSDDEAEETKESTEEMPKKRLRVEEEPQQLLF